MTVHLQTSDTQRRGLQAEIECRIRNNVLGSIVTAAGLGLLEGRPKESSRQKLTYLRRTRRSSGTVLREPVGRWWSQHSAFRAQLLRPLGENPERFYETLTLAGKADISV
jgi:hypothetical protein